MRPMVNLQENKLLKSLKKSRLAKVINLLHWKPKKINMEQTKVLVGLASCGIAAGANKVYNKLLALQESDKLDIEIKKTGCIGMCYREPLVEIIDESLSPYNQHIEEFKRASNSCSKDQTYYDHSASTQRSFDRV